MDYRSNKQLPTRKPRSLQFIVLLLAISRFSWAGDPGANPVVLKNLSLEELSQIEVTTPSREPVKAFRTPSAIFVITGEDIRRSGAINLPAALRLAPGVEVARIDGSKWSIGNRGFGSRLTRSVLVIIDGRTVFTPLFNGTYWEVQDTPMADIERIEVVRGPGGTIWGPNAVNGVINVITKNAKDTQGLLLSAGGGNEEQGFADFRYGGGNGKTFNYRLYGKGFTRGPEIHSDGKNFDDWRAAQTGFRMDWNRSARDKFTLQFDLYRVEAGESVQATSYTQPYSRIINANAELSGGNLSGRWERTIGDGDSVKLQFYYDRSNRNEPNFGENRDTFDVDFLQRIRIPARHQISFGLGARIGPVNNRQVVSGLTFVPAKRTDYLLTAFLQDEIELVKQRLALTLGTKILRTNFTRQLEWEPSARLMWTPNEDHSVWAAFTHAVRTPSDAEANFNLSAYINTTESGTPYFARFNANRNFAPEQLNGYELGYRTMVGKNLYIDITGFYNRYHNLFSQDITGVPFLEPTPQPPHLLLPAQFRNGLRGVTKGAEIAPEWRPVSFWRLRASYSHLHMNIVKAINSGDIGTGPRIEGSSPQHQARLQSSLDMSKNFQMDVAYRYVSALPGQGVKAYMSADARLGWRINDELEISLIGRNLFQPRHFESGGNPGPLVAIRRSAFLKLTWTR